ncbi:MAG: DUF167 family protein [Flavobacteriales bacterium]
MQASPKGASDELLLILHIQPGAKHTEVVGMHGDALKIRLAAPPVDGQANDALIRFLAKAFGVPTRNVSILSGQASRRKRVRIDAPVHRPDTQWC